MTAACQSQAPVPGSFPDPFNCTHQARVRGEVQVQPLHLPRDNPPQTGGNCSARDPRGSYRGQSYQLTRLGHAPQRLSSHAHTQTHHVYRIMESLSLEKTSEIIKSNCQPNTTMPSNPCLEVLHLHILLNTSRYGVSTTSLGSLFQCLTTTQGDRKIYS